MAFSQGLPIFINFRTKGFQSHHKEDCVFNAHAHVAVELSVLAIKKKLLGRANLGHGSRVNVIGRLYRETDTVEVGKHPQVILAMYFYLGQE